MTRLGIVLALTLAACGKGSAPPAQAPKTSARGTSVLPTVAAKPAAIEQRLPAAERLTRDGLGVRLFDNMRRNRSR